MINYISKVNPKKLQGTVLLRLDFNTEDDWRMRAVVPTIKFLLKISSKVVIISHHGRPVGVDKKLSLQKNAVTLSRLLGKKVMFLPKFDFAVAKAEIDKAPKGSIFLFENLRFDAGEEKNSPIFAKQLASLADFYVNDAFAVSHRADASLVAVTKFLPSYAGLELEREILFLSRATKKPAHPVVFIVGGAKAADKLDAVIYFKKKADAFLLGGGPANTLFALQGMDVKKSVRDTDPKDIKKLKGFVDAKNVFLPVDVLWHGDYIWDIGANTAALFEKKIAAAKTILWSGPLGFIEKPAFAKGSIRIAKAIAKNRKALSITGGGETVTFLKKQGLDKKFTFISTGGGALIDYLGGKKLAGIAALEAFRVKAK